MTQTQWIPLQSIPAAGKSLIFEDQDLWLHPMLEFGLPGRILHPLRAEVFVLPQEQGVLFRGRITGSVILPCDRCADDSRIDLDHAFDSFEPYPEEIPAVAGKHGGRKGGGREEKPADEEDFPSEPHDAAVIRLTAHGRGLEINPAALIWEEFSLALPVKPLCGETCKGLCPACGSNRNTESCACAGPEGDPRLAVLRHCKVGKK